VRTFVEVPANPLEIRRARRRAVPQSSRPDSRKFERAVTEPRTAEKRVPQWRGVSHAVTFFLAAGATLRAVALAPPGRATVAIAVHRTGLVPLSGGSALYHRWGVGTVSRR
jgi:hypothetical protein